MSELLALLRDRYSPRHVLKVGVVVAVLFVVLPVQPVELVPFAGAFVLLEGLELARSHSRVDARKLNLAMGAAVLLGGAGLLSGSLGIFGVAMGNEFAPPFFAFVTFLGGWWTLDAYTKLRTDLPQREDEDIGHAEALLQMQVGYLVVESLEDGPNTPAELATDCDMTDSRVRSVLDRCEAAGVVEKRGDRYARIERNIGVTGFVRSNGRRLLARFVRPFRLLAQ